MEIILKARKENFVVYCVEGAGDIQTHGDRNVVIIEGSNDIDEYAKENSLRAVPGPVSGLMDAE